MGVGNLDLHVLQLGILKLKNLTAAGANQMVMMLPQVAVFVADHAVIEPAPLGKTEAAHELQGISYKIVNRLIGFFRENKIEELVLDYSAGNKEAKLLWNKYGFKPVINMVAAKVSDIK